MPFGEELYAGTPNRTESQKYSTVGSDNVRKRFTGYEKDQETGLDFAEARYYNNQHGRFTAVDPLLASGKSANPQTFNRYVYVMNSPLRFTDPSGMQAGSQQGRVYTNGSSYKIFNSGNIEDGYYPFEGDTMFDDKDGYRYHITADGWTQLSKARILDNLSGSFWGDPKMAGLSLQQDREGISNALIGAEIGARNFINSPVTTNLVCPVCRPFGFDTSLRSFGVPLIVGEKQPENTAQAVSAFGTELGLNLLTAKAVGSVNSIRNGGMTFDAYKASRGGNQLLGEIPTTNAAGRTIMYPIRTEYHHVFIPQRTQRAHNLPNWLVNNRLNVWRVNTIQHALLDPYRFRTLPVGLKPRVGWTREFNWFTRFDQQ